MKSKFVVVGSSASLLNVKLGENIDSYERIIRINWYPTNGEFKEHIGTREDIVGFPGIKLKLHIPSVKDRFEMYPDTNMQPKEVWALVAKDMSTELFKFCKSYFSCCNIKIQNNIINEIKETLAPKLFRSHCYSGVRSILAAYVESGNCPIDICGFYNSTDNYDYYFNTKYKRSESEERIKSIVYKNRFIINHLKEQGIVGNELDLP